MSRTILTRSSDFAMHQSIASRQFKMLHIIWKDSQPAVCYVWLSLRRTAAKLPVLVLQFLFSQFSIYFFNFKVPSLVCFNFIECFGICAEIASDVCFCVLIVLVCFLCIGSINLSLEKL